MSNILIAFDESTTCTGYAIFEDEKLIDYGVIVQKSKNVIERISEIAYGIEDLIQRYKPNDIALENVQITMSAPTAKSLMGLQLLIEVLCYRYQINYQTLRTAHWRKVLGLSNSPKIKRSEKKQQTINYIENKYEIKIDKDDISDAIAIGTAYILEKEEGKNG